MQTALYIERCSSAVGLPRQVVSASGKWQDIMQREYMLLFIIIYYIVTVLLCHLAECVLKNENNIYVEIQKRALSRYSADLTAFIDKARKVTMSRK